MASQSTHSTCCPSCHWKTKIETPATAVTVPGHGPTMKESNVVNRILTCPNPARWLYRIAQQITPGGNGCWIWTGALDEDGYGQFAVIDGPGAKTGTSAHRASWLAHVGDIPEVYLELDHLCRNRTCVNPWHLELVTNQVNKERWPWIHRCSRHGQDDGYLFVATDGAERWRCRICQRVGSERKPRKRPLHACGVHGRDDGYLMLSDGCERWRCRICRRARMARYTDRRRGRTPTGEPVNSLELVPKLPLEEPPDG
jgi:hypothetical protein